MHRAPLASASLQLLRVSLVKQRCCPVLIRRVSRQLSGGSQGHHPFSSNEHERDPRTFRKALHETFKASYSPQNLLIFFFVATVGYLAVEFGAGDFLFNTFEIGNVAFSARPTLFTPFTVVNKLAVSPTSFIITIRPLNFQPRSLWGERRAYEQEWQMGTVWSVEFKQPQLQISRQYTPLPPCEEDENGELRFLIRKEKGGEMSRYLDSLQPGERLDVRGPHSEFVLPQNVQEVVFLAGGTGIAPALQIAHILLNTRSHQVKPKIHIIWANRSRKDCEQGQDLGRLELANGHNSFSSVIVQQLRNIKLNYSDHLKVDYFVDEEGTLINQRVVSRAVSEGSPSSTDSKLLFISGPEGFVKFVAGPKRWKGSEEVQGELAGVIGFLGLQSWKVWKF
jgi:cytochrome-b5 reductase